MSLRSNSRSGFTLVEVVLAVMILALLAGVLFALVQGTLEAAGQLNTRQLQNEEFNGLVEVCRKTFQTMDPKAQFTVQIQPADGGGSIQQLTITNAPLAFAWQGTGAEVGTTNIAPRPQANGLLAFCLQQQIDDPSKPAPTEAPKWFVLVRDLKKMDWRFYDARSNEWRKDWPEAGVRPALVELTLNSSMLPDDVRVVFPVLPANATL